MKKKISGIILCIVVLILGFAMSASAQMLGDIDGNGKYTASDARLVLRHAARLEELSEEQQKVADVDKNGKITSADARLILRVAARLDIPFDERNIDEHLIEKGVLNVAVADNRYPFVYTENGEIKGYMIELFKKLEDVYEVEVRFHPVKEYAMRDAIEASAYDIALYADGVYFDDGLKFSEVLYSNHQTAVVDDYISSIDILKEMPGVKIGVIKNSLAEKILLRDKELGVLKADSIVSFTTCLDGKKAVMNKEIYAFVTEHRGAEFMCNDVSVSGVIVSHAYNDVEYLFFGNPESGELIKLISKVVNKEQAEKLVDKYCHYDVKSEIVPSSYTVDVAPGGTAIIKLDNNSFYSPSRLTWTDFEKNPLKVELYQVNYRRHETYLLKIMVPANAKSSYVTVASEENVEVKIKVNVTASASPNYHIAGKTDIPDFGVMTKTTPSVLINGITNIQYTYTAADLNKNGVTIQQARKYYEKLRANGYTLVRGYNDGYKTYENKKTGETVIYREFYTSAGKLDKIVIEGMFLNHIK